MSAGKIVVPEGMIEEAVCWGVCTRKQTRRILEAALRWQSEQPTVPTEAQAEDLDNWAHAQGKKDMIGWVNWPEVIAEWISRMYQAPEPDAPKNFLMETPMKFTVPKAGRYVIGMDYGAASDESVAVVMRCGEGVEPDEEVATLRRDKKTGEWIQDAQTSEDIQDLLDNWHGTNSATDKAQRDIIEAYRRGKASK
jgi:hypothetical protein